MPNSKAKRRAAKDSWRKNAGTTYKKPPTPIELGRGHSRESISQMHEAANRGECWALVNLGGYYDDGLWADDGRLLVRKNRRTAIRYLEKAVALGDIDAMVGLASVFSADRSHRGLVRAAPLYRKAYRRGDHTAAFNLASTYLNLGRYREAVAWYRRALAAGDPDASMELARAELLGLGTRRNTRSAIARLRRIAGRPSNRWPVNGDRIEAILVLADALITGWPVRRNYDEGIRWLRRAAEIGSDVAKAMLESH